MAGISDIVTGGFLFDPSLIVTHGFMSGDGPPPVIDTGERGAWKPKHKKIKPRPAPWERDPISVRASLMAVVDANTARKREALDRQDEEDLMTLLQRFDIL